MYSCGGSAAVTGEDEVPAWVLALAGCVLALVLFTVLALSGGTSWA